MKKLPHFLCDTWWYGLTKRISEEKFEELAKLRVKQGFTAVQMVVGIPPEVGPENINSFSKVGVAWNLKGEFNQDYLRYARKKIKRLNSLGLVVIVYGAWGQQIEWLGKERMKDWWGEIVKNFDDLDVIYCITGESDIWVGGEKNLLPDKSTGELGRTQARLFLHPRLLHLGKRFIKFINIPIFKSKEAKRREKWSEVLSHVASVSSKSVFIHPLPSRTSEEVVNNPQLLDAVTIQTGHDINTRKFLWELPLKSTTENPKKPFINLEPWYEGINDSFGLKDQIYAYWVSMMAGAHAYCYGAHGIWNGGDGSFLSHWGKQTFTQAMSLDAPRLIGASHNLFIGSGFMDLKNVKIEEENGKLIKISRANRKGKSVTYIPDVSLVDGVSEGKIFLPLRGEFVKILPQNGQVVVFTL